MVQLALGQVDEVMVSWQSPLKDADGGSLTGLMGYRVYRSAGGSGSYVQVWEGVELSYRDEGLEPLSTYSYQVSAYDGEGNESEISSCTVVVASICVL